nr:transposase family protein [Bradyrhizobium sp. NBAIM01]
MCPSCGTVSRRIHSRYRRRVTDVPLSGQVVQLLAIARRFRCDAVLYGRQIFTERFADGILAPSARRTARLDSILHHLGLALGGRPAAGFAKRRTLPVSKDTLLHVVRRRSRSPPILSRSSAWINRLPRISRKPQRVMIVEAHRGAAVNMYGLADRRALGDERVPVPPIF